MIYVVCISISGGVKMSKVCYRWDNPIYSLLIECGKYIYIKNINPTNTTLHLPILPPQEEI